MNILRCAAAVLAVFVSQAQAQTTYVHTGYGEGTKSCGTWTQARKGNDLKETNWLVEWSAGYLTATGRFTSNMRTSDNGGMLSFLDKYCQEHPLDTFESANIALARALGAQ
jgi:hypothetical protein